MSNTSQGFNFNLSDKIFFSALFAFMMGAFMLAGALFNARDAAHKDRALAWQEVIEAAPTMDEREVMLHYASRLQGCLVDRSTDPQRLSFSPSIFPSRYRENYHEYLIAHEQACLTNLRGEARASTPEFEDAVFGISVPR